MIFHKQANVSQHNLRLPAFFAKASICPNTQKRPLCQNWKN